MAAKKFLVALDMSQNSMANMQIVNLGTAPSSPVEGQLYWDTVRHGLYGWNANASAWQNYATNSDNLGGQAGSYYLARVNHTGTQLAATISNLAATVQAYTLDLFAAAAGNINLNSHNIINLSTPVNPTDAANKSYVDSALQGISNKFTARVATAAALPANTYANGTAGVGATLTANASGVLTVDGYTVLLGDFVLVNNESTQANNGLYSVTTLGTVSVPYVLTRATDMNNSTSFGGALVAIDNAGTANPNTLWLSSVANSITVGTTAVTFTRINNPTAYTSANSAISISGLVITQVVKTGGGVLIDATLGLKVDRTVVPNLYAAAFGDGSTTAYTITHSLGTQDVIVSVYGNTTPWAEVECDVDHTSTSAVTLNFTTAPTTNQYRVVVHG